MPSATRAAEERAARADLAGPWFQAIAAVRAWSSIFVFDASCANAPPGFEAGVEAVVSYFESHFSDPITITIDVGYGEVDGQPLGFGALAESATVLTSVSYSALEAALVANANAIGDPAAAANIPATSPVSGTWWVVTAEAQALGLSNGGSGPDGYIGLSNSVIFCYDDSNGVPLGEYDFFGVFAHELSEVLGRQMMDGENFAGGTSYEPLDLFHYSAAGVRFLWHNCRLLLAGWRHDQPWQFQH